MSEAAQAANAVLMVRPAAFAFNPQTAASNAFQVRPREPSSPQAQALREFDALAHGLRDAGVRVVAVDDTPTPAKPDAVFPNNWLSFHADGSVVLYPMLAENRRLERREAVIEHAVYESGFVVRRRIDLTHHEREGRFLEGTGSLVLDRRARIAYAALSARTDPSLLAEFAARCDYRTLAFRAVGADGGPVYHTNVVMSVGTRFAVAAFDAIADTSERAALRDSLERSAHEVIALTSAQMNAFAGNLLELRGAAGPVIAISATAWASLDAVQRAALERHGRVLRADVATIERHGGGSVRCMLCEIEVSDAAPVVRARG